MRMSISRSGDAIGTWKAPVTRISRETSWAAAGAADFCGMPPAVSGTLATWRERRRRASRRRFRPIGHRRGAVRLPAARGTGARPTLTLRRKGLGRRGLLQSGGWHAWLLGHGAL